MNAVHMLKFFLGFNVVLSSGAWAQLDGVFLPCGRGIYNNLVTTFYEDQLDDRLYVGGTFIGANDSTAWSPSIIAWDGEQYLPIGCGFEWDCTTPLLPNGQAPGLFALTRWNGDLYVGGQFNSSAGVTMDHIARFDGASWQPVGGGTDATVTSLHPYADGLYATGVFSHAGGVEAHGLARWDGMAWHSVFDLPDWFEPNYINDMIFYQGDLYVGGNFGASGGIHDIARYNGTEWVGCAGGFTGQTSGVYQFSLHDSLLYVAGYLADWPPYGPESNPGSGVATWNGSEWGRLGTGTRYSSNPTVYKMAWLRDTLYIGGIFNTIDGMPSGGLARWDGQAWCSLVPPGYFGNSYQRVGVFRDTLYVGGSFVTGGNDTLNRIAKWTGGYVDTCSVPVGVDELSPELTAGFSVHPNPATDELWVYNQQASLLPKTVRLFDSRGRLVSTSPVILGKPIDISALPSGLYTVVLADRSAGVLGTARFIKQ